jgi:glycosidase
MPRRLSLVVLLALVASLSPIGAGTAGAALGFVGNMFPAGGSSSTIAAGGSFTVYVQAYKNGVTEAPGQGGGIACRLVLASVTSFGGAWGTATETPMVFNTQIGNNDEYKATITPGPGRHEFTANCTDTTDGVTTWQGGGNGRLIVNNTGQCAGAFVGDNNVYYSGLLHDSFSTQYRSPLGPVAASPSAHVRLRFRTCQNDVESVTLRVWDDRTNNETAAISLVAESNAFDATLGAYVTYWKLDLPVGSQPTILYYVFRASDGAATGYYRDDNPKFLGGGFGAAEPNQSLAYDNSYQISVFDPAFATPEWMQRAVIYQIFPDRFRDGDPANNPQTGRFSYGANVSIARSNDPEGDWNSVVCDPRSTNSVPALNCDGRYGDNFYGGDLKGVTQKIQDGYFSSLGVTVLYLNPIFRAPSNHKYDTANFTEIDPDFGTLADFQAMVASANARGIRIMLDGVFNHTSSDSPYFDRYGRYNAAGQLVNPNGGPDDDSGACEAVSSQYRSWFYFPDIGNAGKDGSTIVRCADASGNPTFTYEAWYGYSSLPKLNAELPVVRQYFYGSPNAVGPYWTRQGASGWRFDVGADVDPGLTNGYPNDYWEGFRLAVRNPGWIAKSGPDSQTVMLGEEWGDASPWLLGNEWDSVMNYRFRSAALSWLFTGCSGNGCAGGSKFQENDSNDNSSSGSIAYLSPSQFNARLRSIHEDYPANAFKAMMNLAGSHDTQRIRFLLKKINNDSDAAAVQRLKEWWLFAFTYPGNPTLYYGDEVGLSHDGVWDGSQYQDDPYNRAPFPWPDASGGAYVPDTNNLQAFARQMASLRHAYRALQDGDVQHGMVIDDAKQLYGYGRTWEYQTALVLLNRSGSAQSGTFTGLNAAPFNLSEGTPLVDALSGTTYFVSGGAVTVSVNPTWGAVLTLPFADTPVSPASKAGAPGADVTLSWPIVTSDTAGGVEVITRYEIFRGAAGGFTPATANRIATVTNPAFGGDPSYTDTGAASGGYGYIVRACNAAGQCSDSATVTAARLAVSPASGTYGGGVTLQATLSAGGVGLAGRSVSFTLNGAPAGTAATNSQGVASLPVSLSGIAVGSYPGGVAAAFAYDGSYGPASGGAALTVDKAGTTTVVTCPPDVPYTGAAQTPCTATVTGPGGLSQPAPISYSDNTNAGTATATASYPGDGNYEASSSSKTFSIGAVGSTTTIICPASVTYTGAAQTPCTATVTGSGGLSQSLIVTYQNNTNAGTATATASYPGDGNHAASSSSVTFVIDKATTTTTITCPASVTYTGAAQTPCTATVTGPGGLSQPAPISYSDNTNAGTATATASYPGDGNYEASGANTTFAIAKADQTIALTAPASAVVGSPFTVAATATSGLPVTLSVGGPCGLSGATVAPTGAGSCVVTASQAGDSNHNAAPPVVKAVAISAPPTTYSFSGFFSPVDNPPTINTVKAGSAIPVKFSLGGNYGLGIFQSGFPSVASLDCPAAAPSDAIEATVSATANSLNYDAATAQYTFVWKSDKAFAGSCKQLVLKFSDGTTRTATFRFAR